METRRCPKCHGKGIVEIPGHQLVDFLAERTFTTTHEEIYVFGPFAGTLSSGAWGSVEDGFLVLVGRTGRGYLFQPEGPLGVEYVATKLGAEFIPGAHGSAGIRLSRCHICLHDLAYGPLS